MLIRATGQSTHVGDAIAGGRARRERRIAHSGIIGSGLLVLALLAWVHLGVGALLFPPAPGPTRQVATAGSWQVTMLADSGEMMVGEHNTISLLVRDATQHAVTGATVTVAADMLTMPMPVPDVPAAWTRDRYTAHPIFTMAGPWKLTVTIASPGQPAVHTDFRVGVRWRA